ncbi:hypothetical protein ACQZV8_19170 [Magnetococcales bacterium HHB-1]
MTIELTDGARVAVVGGGPSGSLTAYFLLEVARRVNLTLHVDIYDPKPFYQTGPVGCNLCGGVISESLIELLATEGIALPEEVIIDVIDAYTLNTSSGSVTIQAASDEHRIATIYRGGGPRGAEHQRPLPWDSFDWFLLRRAVQQGANHIPLKVRRLSWNQDRPQLWVKGREPETYDFLVGAVGLLPSNLKLFNALDFGYIQPKTCKAFIAELYYGAEEVERRLEGAMQVFLLDFPGLKFAALTPKGHYATLVILGDQIDPLLVRRFLKDPVVKARFPPGWEIPVQPCQCRPPIFLADQGPLFTDRVVMVGDSGVSRLYKDGIGAAYLTAKICAVTAITHGISKESFEEHYLPTCRELSRDNRLGHMLFFMDFAFKKFAVLRRMMLQTIKKEQRNAAKEKRYVSKAFWDMFTGSGSYHEISAHIFHPGALARLLFEFFKALVSLLRRNPDPPHGRDSK